MTILDKIIAQKKRELVDLINRPLFERVEKPVPSFKKQVSASDKLNIIAEIKRKSPSKGDINTAVDPVEQARMYEKSGAAAISVLTDETFFNGSLADLRAVRKAVDLPILCKDFIIDTLQIDYARAAGATMILLIVAALSDQDLKKLYDYATSVGLEVLVEVHDEKEMERALKLNPEIIGINNRDLKTFTVDLSTTERLAPLALNSGAVLISESGMRERKDAERAMQAGAKGILVGETLMRARDLQVTFEELSVPLVAGSGFHAR